MRAGREPRKRTAKENRDERIRKGLCLLCGDHCNTRGLCIKHYHQFVAARRELPVHLQDAFDRRMVREGKILQSFTQRAIRNPTPFGR